MTNDVFVEFVAITVVISKKILIVKLILDHYVPACLFIVQITVNNTPLF